MGCHLVAPTDTGWHGGVCYGEERWVSFLRCQGSAKLALWVSLDPAGWEAERSSQEWTQQRACVCLRVWYWTLVSISSFVKHLLSSYYVPASLLGAMHSQKARDCWSHTVLSRVWTQTYINNQLELPSPSLLILCKQSQGNSLFWDLVSLVGLWKVGRVRE